MINTTLCYLQRGEEYLMLHRVKKENDLNQDKWIGVGGKFEDKESPEDCALREIREETGLTATGYRYRGLVKFLSDRWPTEYMHLFTVHSWTGELKECDEGDLEWVPKARLKELPLWDGDHIFLDLLDQEAPFFSLKLSYVGDKLVEAVVEGYSELIEELLARIRAALRKRGSGERPEEPLLSAGPLTMDVERHTVAVSGTPVELTRREFDLLHHLLENKGRVLSREALLDSVWGFDFVGETNSVDVYIRFLRSKIDEAFGIKLIHTVRGGGYVIKEE